MVLKLILFKRVEDNILEEEILNLPRLLHKNKANWPDEALPLFKSNIFLNEWHHL